jgi:Mrp family chromosome partitioning ATPase
VVFFGVEDESGSSAVCANAAQALARNTSKPVCVVDANISSARLSRILGITRVISFPGKPSSVREQCIQISDNLWFAGVDLMMDARGGMLPVDELKHQLAQLSSAFEYLIIDAPGTEVSGDAEILGHIADAAVLVVEANRTRRAAVGKAKESLESAGVRLLGTVLNDRTFPIPERLNRFL